MTLDERARSASRAIERSVEGVSAPELGARTARTALVYAEMAALFALLVVGLVLLRTSNVIGPARTSVTLGKQVASIPLGHIPSTIVTGQFGEVWVASNNDGMVLKVDTTGDRVIGSVHVGKIASSLVLNAGTVWVASDPSGVVTQVDAETLHIVRRVTLAHSVTGLAVQGDLIWAATSDGRLDAIDPANGIVRHDFLVAPNIQGLVAAGGSLWTVEPQIGFNADTAVGYVLRVDPRSGTVLHAFLMGEIEGPNYITAYAGAVWMGSQHPGNVKRIDPLNNSMQTLDVLGVYIADLVSPDVGGSSARGLTLWLIAGDYSPRSYLLQLNTHTGDVLRRVTLDDEGVGPAVGPGTLWVGQSTSKRLLRFQLIEH
ncbi:MAG: hypothetical protein ACXVD8_12530 [Actinomycetota bacterium]